MQDYSNLPLLSLQPETREIPLSQGKVAIVDAADYEWLSQWKWCTSMNKGGIWYARRSHGSKSEKRTIMMHRFIMEAQPGIMVDHVNGDGLDNRRSNLRFATNQQNRFNSHKQRNNPSGYKGVYWLELTKRWHAQMRVGGKSLYLGVFLNAEDAARAYDNAAKELQGEFARLNFPGE